MKKEETVPYQFYMPKSLHEKAMAKAGKVVDLSIVMRMRVEQFVSQPLAKTVALLEKHNRAKGEKKTNVRRKRIRRTS